MLRGEAANVTTHPKQSTSAPERQRQVHLPIHYQHELIERYKAGATQRELAGQYGVHRTTVTKILQRHGVESRRGLRPDLIDEAIRRYEEGQSLATVGRALIGDAVLGEQIHLAVGLGFHARQSTAQWKGPEPQTWCL